MGEKLKLKLKKFDKNYIHKTNYFEWLKDKEVTKFIYRNEFRKKIDYKKINNYLNQIQKSKNDFFFMICYDGIPIGTLKIGSIDWYGKTADIGIMIGEKSYWGKGIATLSIKLAKEYSKKKLHLRKLTSGTPIKNIGMIKAFKKNGFKMEGIRKKQLLIDNRYCDHILFGKFI